MTYLCVINLSLYIRIEFIIKQSGNSEKPKFNTNQMIRPILLSIILLIGVNSLYAQDDFTPEGKPILRIYNNFHSGLTSSDNNSVFEIDRAYIGYNYKMSPDFSAVILMDIGSPNDESVYAMVKRYAYFKNAYVKYSKNNFSVSMGIVGMNHFKVQEKFWGYRYISKSFSDKYKFGRSADLGAILAYELNDNISIDAAIVNGEGYSQLQTDSKFEYTFGTTVELVESLILRAFMNYGPSAGENKMVYAGFVGYRFSKLSIGAEYNHLANNRYNLGQNQFGYSFYSTYRLKDTWKIFGRYDILESNILEGTDTPWNLSRDGTSIIAGVEKQFHKNLRISLNYQDWYSKAANIANDAYIYCNIEFKL